MRCQIRIVRFRGKYVFEVHLFSHIKQAMKQTTVRLPFKRKYQPDQRSLETSINLLYSIYPDRKHRFGKEKKLIYRFKMVYFWLGRYCTNQLISLSEFPVIYGQTYSNICGEKAFILVSTLLISKTQDTITTNNKSDSNHIFKTTVKLGYNELYGTANICSL
jgi:hypothetical protein